MLEVLYFAARFGLAGVLTLALWSKVRDPAAFRAGIRTYGLVPRRMADVVAVLVPAGEFAAVAALVTDVPRGAGAALAALLFGAFSVALLVNVLRGHAVPCHCFGSSATEVIDWTSTLRTIVLTVTSLAVLRAGSENPGWPAGTDVLAGASLAAGAVLVARLASFLPGAWAYLREEPTAICGTEWPRYVSLRGRPGEMSINDLFLLPPAESGGSR